MNDYYEMFYKLIWVPVLGFFMYNMKIRRDIDKGFYERIEALEIDKAAAGITIEHIVKTQEELKTSVGTILEIVNDIKLEQARKGSGKT